MKLIMEIKRGGREINNKGTLRICLMEERLIRKGAIGRDSQIVFEPEN